MRIIFICILLMLSTTLWAAEEASVFGDNHCFHFSAPAGWVADHAAGKNKEDAYVLYPSGSSSKATTLIYARVVNKSKNLREPRDQVAQRLQQSHTKHGSTNTRAQKVGDIKTKSGAVGEMYKFTGDKSGNAELAVYFIGKNTINFFVMTSRDAKELDKSGNVLEKLARSYREASDCKSCDEPAASACKAGTESLQYYGMDSNQPLSFDKNLGK